DSYLDVNRERNIDLRFKKIKQILGIDIEDKKISNILTRLGIKNSVYSDRIYAFIPSFRFEDIEREIDLVEEVARIYGFENIPAQQLDFKSGYGKYNFAQKRLKEIRQAFENIGLNEVINYSFIGLKEFNFFNLGEEKDYKDYVKILNPLNEDFEILRTSLIQSLIKNLRDNISRKIQDLRIFEISKIFLKDEFSKKGLPMEKTKLAVLFSGKANLKSWNNSERIYDFFDLKGLLEYLFQKFQLKDGLKIKANECKFFHPAISGDIYFNNDKLGIIGKLHPKLIDILDIKQDVYYMELNLDDFIVKTDTENKFIQIPQFPSNSIDLAIVIAEDIENSEVEEEIYKNSGNMLVSLRLFDLYKGKQVEEGMKSLAYSLEFRAPDRTLKDIEIDIISKRIVESLNKRFGAKLRQ
ncbi:MAG: phenylalanine--tRNA ligase subunit beta, partial [Candidatus Humimicrobiaceae bacterium]